MSIRELKRRHNVVYRNLHILIGAELGRVLRKPERILAIEDENTRRAICELYLIRKMIQDHGGAIIIRENGIEIYK